MRVQVNGPSLRKPGCSLTHTHRRIERLGANQRAPVGHGEMGEGKADVAVAVRLVTNVISLC
jgi:hypothetical protein